MFLDDDTEASCFCRKRKFCVTYISYFRSTRSMKIHLSLAGSQCFAIIIFLLTNLNGVISDDGKHFIKFSHPVLISPTPWIF